MPRLQVGLGLPSAKAWARLAEHMAGHPAALRKALMMLVADYITASVTLPTSLKPFLLPGIYALLDALTSFEVRGGGSGVRGGWCRHIIGTDASQRTGAAFSMD